MGKLKNNMDYHYHDLITVLALFFGAAVGVLRRIVSSGWKGWVWFFSTTLSNLLVGFIAVLIASKLGYDWYSVIVAALLFGSMGEKAGDMFLQDLLKHLEDRYKTHD